MIALETKLVNSINEKLEIKDEDATELWEEWNEMSCDYVSKL